MYVIIVCRQNTASKTPCRPHQYTHSTYHNQRNSPFQLYGKTDREREREFKYLPTRTMGYCNSHLPLDFHFIRWIWILRILIYCAHVAWWWFCCWLYVWYVYILYRMPCCCFFFALSLSAYYCLSQYILNYIWLKLFFQIVHFRPIEWAIEWDYNK